MIQMMGEWGLKWGQGLIGPDDLPTAEVRPPRASCFWVYAYPAFLMDAAHSLGLYWARISPQAAETDS